MEDGVDRDGFIDGLLEVHSFSVEIVRRFTIINAFSAELMPKALHFVQRMDGVKYIEQNGLVFADQSIASWGLDRVDQRYLPLDDVFVPEGDGAGVNVYVLDTGIRFDHVDFGGRAAPFYDAIGNPPEDGDCNGHGTHCAGTVGGEAHGIAKKVNLWSVRVLRCTGSGPRDAIIEGLEYVRENGTLPGGISMSIGGSASEAYNDVVNSVVLAGFFVSVSAGNDGREHGDACLKSPASAELAIACGATDSNDVRAEYSNWGVCMNIFAPGDQITSCTDDSPISTGVKSGTSMACPHVAGVCAVIVGNDPTLTPSEVWKKIQEDATQGIVGDAKEEDGTPNLLVYNSLNYSPQ
ncbi:aqualysin-1-like [Saccoglossus kowalevskii]